MDLLENLLGLILEREGALTRDQVNEVRAEQARLRAAGKIVAFGQVALVKGLVTEPQLRLAVILQKKIAWPQGQPVPIGAQMLAAGIVKPSDLVAALEEQAKSGAMLGQILIRRGAIKAEVLAHYLESRLMRR